MANVDAPFGFRPVKSLNGSPVSGLIRSVGVASGADIFVGDPLSLSSGLAGPAASNAQVIGVAVGFGKTDSMSDNTGNSYGDPANLNTPNFYDDSASTNTEWVVYYVPSENVVFEAQTDAADTLVVGEGIDFVDNDSGSQTTGLSAYELNGGVATNSDCIVVEVPNKVDNDPTLIGGHYWVMFSDTLTR